mgnify:CR=1 FL=1
MAIQDTWNATEKKIYRAWESGKIHSVGVNRTCEAIGKEVGATMSSIKSLYSRMKKYGAFPQKKKYTQLSLRMPPEMHEELRDLAYDKKKSINNLLLQGVRYVLRRG